MTNGQYLFELAAIITIPTIIVLFVLYPSACITVTVLGVIVAVGVVVVVRGIDFILAPYERQRLEKMLADVENEAFKIKAQTLQTMAEHTHKRIQDIMDA